MLTITDLIAVIWGGGGGGGGGGVRGKHDSKTQK